jgi:pimeloyl-ACP methyl ester carboxylesterase
MEPVSGAPILVLGHGASGSAATMAPHVAGLRARGIDARAIDLPKGRAERAVPRFAALLAGSLTADGSGITVGEAETAAGLRLAVGGHSFGGRVASLAAVWLDATAAKKPRPAAGGFGGVPEAALSYHIGGFQVCEKWLRDRKGRTLSADDIHHYQKIIVAITETIRLVGEIDEVIDKHGGWPGAFAAT